MTLNSQDWTLVAVTFYVLTLIVLLIYTLKIRRASLFEPVSLFLFFVSLFALPLPIRYSFTTEIEGNVSPLLPQFGPYLPSALVLTAISLVIFILGYFSQWATALGNTVPLLRNRGIRGTRIGIVVLTGFSIVLIYLLTKSLGGIFAFLLLGYKSSEETFGRGYLAVGFPWLVVAMLAFFDRYAAHKKITDAFLGLILLLSMVVIFAITGNRGMIMYLVISTIIFVNFRIRAISLKTLIPIALFGFLTLNLMGTLRGSDYSNLTEFIEKTFLRSDAASDLEKENFFYTLTVGEFVVPFETFPQMIRSIGLTESPWFGWSFIRAPVYLIPSFIFEDRPLPLGNWYMAHYYQGAALNEGRAFFFLAEGYLNFGVAGVFLVAAAWGVIWGALHRWMLRGQQRFGSVLIYSLLSAFMFRCIAGDITTLLVGTTQQSLAAVFIILITANSITRLLKKP